MSKHRTIGRFDESHSPENARGYFVQNGIGVTVAGPFAERSEAWAEEDRLNAQAEAEAQRSGARPVDPIACATELVHLWIDESIEARVRHYAGHLPSLDRLTDCNQASRDISCAIASERSNASEGGIAGRLFERVEGYRRYLATYPDDADAHLRAAFAGLLAQDTADRLSGAIAMDYPLPVLP